MAYLKIAALSLFFILVAACTATPEKYKTGMYKSIPDLPGQSATGIESTINAAKAQAVAVASIGVPEIYVDPQLGTSVELVVESEYFSANGRTCRRYAEFVDGQSAPGVSCQSNGGSWVDIPVSSFVR